MLRKIKVYGRLRKFIGQSVLEADVNSPIEVLTFLHCNFKGLEKHMADQYYQINCGDVKITEELLGLRTESDFQIIPLAHGNFFTLLIGAGLKFLGGSIGTKLLGSKLLATVVSGALTSIGTSMLIDGVTSLIAPQPQNTQGPMNMTQEDPAALASNYSFTGLTNVSTAGVPINLVYGEIFVGSITISNGVDTVQVEGSN